MRCDICGKEFDRGATIRSKIVFCPECDNKYEDIINDIAFKCLKAKGKELVTLETLVTAKENIIKEFKLPISFVKMEIVRLIKNHRF